MLASRGGGGGGKKTCRVEEKTHFHEEKETKMVWKKIELKQEKILIFC